MQIEEHQGEALRTWVSDQLGGALDFVPPAIVTIRKAWELSEVVAEVLADALGGLVTDDATLEAHYRADAPPQPIQNMAELEQRLRHAFAHPEPYLARQQQRERQPSNAGEDDWSDV
jgi:hypothetical protein